MYVYHLYTATETLEFQQIIEVLECEFSYNVLAYSTHIGCRNENRHHHIMFAGEEIGKHLRRSIGRRYRGEFWVKRVRQTRKDWQRLADYIKRGALGNGRPTGMDGEAGEDGIAYRRNAFSRVRYHQNTEAD